MRREYRAGPHIRRGKGRPRARLLTYALRLGFATPDAEDLVQEVFVLLPTLRPTDGPVRDWFGLLVGCLQKSALSARTRERRRCRILEQRPPAAEVDPSPEDRWIARRMVEQVMDRLPPADAELLRWRFLEDPPPREIAKRLGIPEGTARMRLQRALAKAKAVLGVQ